jgi:predicted transcriptional regulator
MAEDKLLEFFRSDHLLDEEDEPTLAAIDRGLKAADEGRLIPAEEVRRRLAKWLTESSTPPTR